MKQIAEIKCFLLICQKNHIIFVEMKAFFAIVSLGCEKIPYIVQFGTIKKAYRNYKYF